MPSSARGWRAFCAVMLAAVSISCAVLPTSAIDAIAEAYLQQGKRSYDRGDYAAAARLFNKAARDAENTYNNKLYVAAIYHNAAQAYSKLADVNGSYTDVKDDDLTVKFLQSRLRDFGDPEEFGHDKVNVDETDLELQGRKLINRSKPMAGSAESRMKMQWIAVHYLRLALEIKETAAGAGSVEVANSMEALALLYEKYNARLDEAEALMRKALAIKETALGKTSAELAITLYNLGMVMKTSAQYCSAFAAMFHLGSITRYKPYDFDKIIEDYSWLISEFLDSQPTKMLHILASLFAGTKVVSTYAVRSGQLWRASIQ